MRSSPQLLLPQVYLKDATRRIQCAKHHVSLLTMIVVEDETTQPLIDALCEAALRGIAVTVTADTFTYSEVGGHMRLHTKNSLKVRHIAAMQHRLVAAGVHFRWLGKSTSSLVNGRTHSKWLVVDDYVYTFGGVNIYEHGITNIDYMFRLDDTILADRIVSEQQRIIKADKNGHTYRSHAFGDDTNLVLVDGGFFGDSIIYRHACRLTAEAKKVTYVSQYCPTGKLGRLLKKTDSTLYFNQWNKADSLNALVIRAGSFISNHKTIYTRDTYLHAKCMIFELENGKKAALSGSHNFSHGGVWLGTREIALETRDPRIIHQLELFIKTHVA